MDNRKQKYYSVYYEVDGKEYLTLILSNKDLTNQSTIIYYKKADPHECISKIEAKVREHYELMILGCVTVIIGIAAILAVKKEEKTVKWLANNGTLISNLPYELLEYYSIRQPWTNYEKIKVNYQTIYGETLTLVSEPKYYFFNMYPEVVDLLIDLNDTSKYFIDFNIREYTDEY